MIQRGTRPATALAVALAVITASVVGVAAVGSAAAASDDLQDAPFTQEFEDGLAGWTVDLNESWASRANPGTGSWSSRYDGSVRLHVDGGPNHIGLYRQVGPLEEDTRIVAHYESPNLEGEPGGPRLLLHYPDGSTTTIDRDWGGGGSHASEHNGTLVGTVPDEVPEGTYLEFRLGVWPGEITTYVENVSVGTEDDVEGVALSLRPAEPSIAPDETVTYDVVAEGADQGVGSYDLTVNTSNASAAEITAVTTEIDGLGETSVAGDGSGARLASFNGETADSGPVTVGTVTVTGVATGSADLSLRARSISNESGGQYRIGALRGATVTVEEVAPIVGDSDARATDPDSDGVYEDVNGDRAVTVGDATLLLEAIRAGDSALGPPFDVNRDGIVNAIDARALFAAALEADAPPAEGGPRIGLTLQPPGEDGLEIEPRIDNASVEPNGSITYQLTGVIPSAETDGVGAYELVVAVDDPATARITGASDAINGSAEVDLAEDGSSVRIAAFGGDAGTGDLRVVLASVTVTGVSPGNATLTVEPTSVSDETGANRYTVDTRGTTLTVREPVPTVGASSNPATDPDRDGLYEDVNGDGEATPGDATVLFNAVFSRDPAVLDNVELFDFTDDDEVTPGDATVLFEEVF